MKNPFPLFACLLALLPLTLQAQIPQLLEYDGYLLENGKPVTGNRTLAVRLHSARSGGTVLYRETIGTVRVSAGEFYFQYGQNGTAGNGTAPTGILPALTGNQQWLSITVNGTEQTPRERLLSVPFALRSADAQKTDADLRKVVDAVGRVVVAFGGNSSDLLKNPAQTVATIRKTATDLLEVRKQAEVIPLSGGNLTAQANRTYALVGDARGTIELPRNAKPGDSVHVLGAGVTIKAPGDSLIIDGWTPLEIEIPGVGELIPTGDSSRGLHVIGSDDARVLYTIASDNMQTDSYLVRSMDAGLTWSSIQTVDGEIVLQDCSSDGSRLLYRAFSGDDIRLISQFGNQTKVLSGPSGSNSMDDPVYMSRNGARIYWIASNSTSGAGELFLSENDGASWQAANQTVGGKSLDLGSPTMGDRLRMSPDGRILLIAGMTENSPESKLFITQDFGKNWRKLNLPIDSETGDEVVASSFLISNNGNTIVVFNNDAGPPKRYLSQDQGRTWTASTSRFTPDAGGVSPDEFGKRLAKHDLSQIFWADYVSTDFGRQWNKVSMPRESEYESNFFSFISRDAHRKIAFYDTPDYRPIKSWVHAMISKGSTEMVYLGSGNWIAR